MTPWHKYRCLEFDYSALALSLFVFGVFADHPDFPLPFYNFTLVADFFDRCPDFHSFYLNSLINTATRKLCPEPHMVQGLFLPKNNSPPREIIGGEFHHHLISGEDFDEVHSHLSRNMGQHLMAVFQFYPEHRIGKGFQNLPFHLDRVLLWHNVSIRALKRALRLIDG